MPKGKPKEARVCPDCGSVFQPTNNAHVYCSRPCKRRRTRAIGCEPTERQYELISGNWKKYFNRLCSRSFAREELTADMLIELLAQQDGKCALSGAELTCTLQKGVRSKTNASIDRVDPKGRYVIENVQLVCSAINKFRIDTPVDEFVEWCRKVANYAVRK